MKVDFTLFLVQNRAKRKKSRYFYRFLENFFEKTCKFQIKPLNLQRKIKTISNTFKILSLMTQKEFTQRTNVEVNYKEFEAIHEVYMNCDLDKDEFCKTWCKMNKSRIAKAKADAKAKKEDEAFRSALYNFYMKNDNNVFQTLICYVKVSAFEVQAMSYAGITVKDEYGHTKYLSDIRYEIGKFLKLY